MQIAELRPLDRDDAPEPIDAPLPIGGGLEVGRRLVNGRLYVFVECGNGIYWNCYENGDQPNSDSGICFDSLDEAKLNVAEQEIPRRIDSVQAA